MQSEVFRALWKVIQPGYMSEEYVAQKIEELGPWYQTIKMAECLTKPEGLAQISGRDVWLNLRQLLPIARKQKEPGIGAQLKGLRILDLGCNAGYYCVKSAALKAEEVVGVEAQDIYLKQAEFVKEYFEHAREKELPIKFIQGNLSDMDFESLGKFDYVYMLSIIYHIAVNGPIPKEERREYPQKHLDEQVRVMDKLLSSGISNNFIVRTRDVTYWDSVEYYDRLFWRQKYRNMKTLDTKRPMMLYRKVR